MFALYPRTLRADIGAKATVERDSEGKLYEVYKDFETGDQLEVKYFDFRLLLLKVYSGPIPLREVAIRCIISIITPRKCTYAADFSVTVDTQTIDLIKDCERFFKVLGPAALRHLKEP